MATFGGGLVEPTTARSAIPGLSPLALLADGWPPLATRYNEESLPVVTGTSSENRPSAPVRACASWFGSPAVAAHSVTVELAIGAPAPSTWPVMVPAALAGPPPSTRLTSASTGDRRAAL